VQINCAESDKCRHMLTVIEQTDALANPSSYISVNALLWDKKEHASKGQASFSLSSAPSKSSLNISLN